MELFGMGFPVQNLQRKFSELWKKCGVRESCEGK